VNFVQDILKDLREKPLLGGGALLLIVLLVAVPMMLSKPGPPTVVASLPGNIAEEPVGPELNLTRANTTGFARAPHVNDKELDPFGARIDPKELTRLRKLKAAAEKVATGDSTTNSGGGSVDPGGVTPVDNNDPGTDPTPTTSPDTTPKVKTEQDDLLSILYTSADDAAPKEITDIRTLSPLPDADDPFLVYVGRGDNDTATFLVSADAVATGGGGTCLPSLADCRTLTLAEGETENFTLPAKDNAKVSITVTDITTKKVPVDDGTDETASAARLETRARVIGAKALKSVLDDPAVTDVLIKQHVKIRTY
jgi:hypothetical protein